MAVFELEVARGVFVACGPSKFCSGLGSMVRTWWAEPTSCGLGGR